MLAPMLLPPAVPPPPPPLPPPAAACSAPSHRATLTSLGADGRGCGHQEDPSRREGRGEGCVGQQMPLSAAALLPRSLAHPPARPPTHPLQGVNVTALREVKLLRELRSPHVVRLLDVLPQKRGINLVMEFCESDLEHVIKDRARLLSAGDVKAYMQVRRCWRTHTKRRLGMPACMHLGQPQQGWVQGTCRSRACVCHCDAPCPGPPVDDPAQPGVLPQPLGGSPRHQAKQLPGHCRRGAQAGGWGADAGLTCQAAPQQFTAATIPGLPARLGEAKVEGTLLF